MALKNRRTQNRRRQQNKKRKSLRKNTRKNLKKKRQSRRMRGGVRCCAGTVGCKGSPERDYGSWVSYSCNICRSACPERDYGAWEW